MPEDTPTPYGPRVPGDEKLYRMLTEPSWWVKSEKRVSSAAVGFPCFSVDIASLSTPAESRARVPGTFAIVSFLCAEALTLGYDARHEADDLHPENKAHAHVYLLLSNTQRKKAAKRLAEQCQIVMAPDS